MGADSTRYFRSGKGSPCHDAFAVPAKTGVIRLPPARRPCPSLVSQYFAGDLNNDRSGDWEPESTVDCGRFTQLPLLLDGLGHGVEFDINQSR